MSEQKYMRRSLITVTNDAYAELTGKPFLKERVFNAETRTWTYKFADGSTRATYAGALLHLQQRLTWARSLRTRR